MRRSHLVEPHGDATARGLPGGFAAGQAGSDDDQMRRRCASCSGLHGRADHNALAHPENTNPAIAILGDDAFEFEREQLLRECLRREPEPRGEFVARGGIVTDCIEH